MSERFGYYTRKDGGGYLAVDLVAFLANLGRRVEQAAGWRGWLVRRVLGHEPCEFDPRPLTAVDSRWKPAPLTNRNEEPRSE